MPRKTVLVVLLIATFACPQQLFAAPHTDFTTWLGELVTRLVTIWDTEATDQDVVQVLTLSTESEQPGNQQAETDSSAEEEPPIANIYPGWEPIG